LSKAAAFIFSGRKSKETVRRADAYIEENKKNIGARYRHTYHAMPPVGWMNDPNGFCRAFGKYHLFYQFYPYGAKWGPMHWGHYTTDDFVKWNLEPTALAPGEGAGYRYDKDGCFSGSAIVKDGVLYLMYTAVSRGRQTQALAMSKDGKTFEKLGVVIGRGDIPPKSRSNDFRDPKIFERDGIYYSLIGSRHKDGKGQIVLYKSEDILNWKYAGTVLKDDRTLIYECPDLSRLEQRDGVSGISLGYKDILIASPQRMKKNGYRNENLHGSLYAIGRLDVSSGSFDVDFEDEIDGGTDFYAPQTLTAADGRVIMTAWMQMWERTMPTQKYGWAGAMILTRELTLKSGRLFQSPVREIEAYRKNKTEIREIPLNGAARFDGAERFFGTAVEIEAEFDTGTAARTGIKLFKGANETAVYYDRAENFVVFDRTRSGEKIIGAEKDANIRRTKAALKENRIKFRVFLDASCVEIFINDGERVMTGNVYPDGADTGIEFYSDGGSATVIRAVKYDLSIDLS
jgi:beta-fructofuranosidase